MFATKLLMNALLMTLMDSKTREFLYQAVRDADDALGVGNGGDKRQQVFIALRNAGVGLVNNILYLCIELAVARLRA